MIGLEESLARYAAAHRDRRNIATHMVGVPMVIFGCGVLLAHGQLSASAMAPNLAWLVWCIAMLWVVSRGHLGLGLAVSAITGALFALAQLAAAGTVVHALGWGLGFVLAGVALQWLGHCYEGRRPTWSVQPHSLLVAPMFVGAEVLFALGMAQPLRRAIERRAGPTVLRDLAHPVA